MSALERAEEDVRRGDYGLARQRLASYLSTNGYDPDLLARLGQISHDMRDVHQAGRFWLTSTAQGEEVEQAVAVFLRRAGTDPASIVAQLPPTVRQPALDVFPELVRDRLRRHRLEKAIIVAARRTTCPGQSTWGGRIATVGCLLVALSLLVIFVAGLVQGISWLFGF